MIATLLSIVDFVEPWGSLGLILVAFVGGWWVGRSRLKVAVMNAHVDKLTGLPDRTIMDRALSDAEQKHLGITVAVVDVNGLHDVNDRLGHLAGDQLLVAVSHRLLECLPVGHGGLVARSGGDEFTIISEAAPEDLAHAYELDGTGLALASSAAIGIASCPKDGSPLEALAKADVGMFEAKRAHVPVVIYDSSLGDPNAKGDESPSAIRDRRGNTDRRVYDRRSADRRTAARETLDALGQMI